MKDYFIKPRISKCQKDSQVHLNLIFFCILISKIAHCTYVRVITNKILVSRFISKLNYYKKISLATLQGNGLYNT